jgi:hypothetical protein
MSKHDQMIRDARAAHRLAQAATRRANAAIIALEFPSRPRPVYVALGMGNDFSIVETDEATGELVGVVIPFPRRRK